MGGRAAGAGGSTSAAKRCDGRGAAFSEEAAMVSVESQRVRGGQRSSARLRSGPRGGRQGPQEGCNATHSSHGVLSGRLDCIRTRVRPFYPRLQGQFEHRPAATGPAADVGLERGSRELAAQLGGARLGAKALRRRPSARGAPGRSADSPCGRAGVRRAFQRAHPHRRHSGTASPLREPPAAERLNRRASGRPSHVPPAPDGAPCPCPTAKHEANPAVGSRKGEGLCVAQPAHDCSGGQAHAQIRATERHQSPRHRGGCVPSAPLLPRVQGDGGGCRRALGGGEREAGGRMYAASRSRTLPFHQATDASRAQPTLRTRAASGGASRRRREQRGAQRGACATWRRLQRRSTSGGVTGRGQSSDARREHERSARNVSGAGPGRGAATRTLG